MSDDPALLIPDPVVAEDAKLRRALGPVHLTMIGVGATIGAGIFVIAGTVSAQHAGPAVLPEPYAFCPIVANALSTVPTLTLEFSTES